jgi:sugar phosphate isomerase/epimerase
MKMGLLTAPFATTPLEEVADWSAAQGFEMLEVCAWPTGGGATRRYGGVTHIDVEDLSEERASEIVEDLAKRGVSISGLGYYPNPLHPDPEHAETVRAHIKKVITAAAMLDVPVVNTFIGADASKTQADNWADAKKVWPELVDHAADHGVRIAIENCPMIFSHDEWPSGHNLAHTPSMWRTMFEEFGETVGLNFDPSHLVWQMIDYERALYDFADRIFHVHAKDMEVRRDGLYEHGVMSLGMGWQVPRLPGLGEVRWDRFVAALYAIGYDDALVIEHEDRKFEGSEELVKRGFEVARNALRPYVV